MKGKTIVIILLIAAAIGVFVLWRWKESKPSFEDADVNGDGRVNVLDMASVGQHFGETGPPGWIPEDINKDGIIDEKDQEWITHYWTG